MDAVNENEQTTFQTARNSRIIICLCSENMCLYWENVLFSFSFRFWRVEFSTIYGSEEINEK